MLRLVARVVLLAVVLVPAAAFGQLRDENLLTGLPGGFKIGYQAQSGQLTMNEFVPKAESVENWSTMITSQVFHGRGGADGDAFAGELGKVMGMACKGTTFDKVTSGSTNGYPFVVWAYACPLNPDTGKPESMWLKAVNGKDALYVVQYAVRKAPDAGARDAAIAYLGNTSVCDTREPKSQCPPGM